MAIWRHQPAPATPSGGDDLGVVLGRSHALRASIGLLVLGLLLTAFATWWSLERGSRLAAEDLASRGELLVFGTEELIEDASRQVAAAASLFRASDHVEPDEFGTFVTEMGLMSGILGMGYVPAIPDTELEQWVTQTRREVPDLVVFELGEDKLPTSLRHRDLRFPLVYFEPFELFSGIAGLDLGYQPDWYEDLVQGLSTDGVTMATFVDLGLPAPLDDDDQFLLGSPIADRITGAVDSLVVGVLDLGLLIDADISDEVTGGIVWDVFDLASETPAQEVVEGAWTGELSFGDRTWMFVVEAASPDRSLLRGTAMYPFFGGLALTILMVTVGFLAVSRATGRRREETLESLNIAKDEFLAAVSHRLRTPLTSVVGFSEILKERDVGLSEMDRRELLSTIAVQAIELGHLFDNLLTVTRDTNRAMFSPSRVNVAAELNTVLDTMEPARRAKVRVVAADPEVVVAADPALTRQIVRNLIANATDFGDHVELSVIDQDHIARIVVRDNGPGVPEHRRTSIFELYDNSSDDLGQPKSMGVGLFVSRRLARRMSGNITYRRENSQTVFELSLPALPTPVAIDRLLRTVPVH